jgi:ribosomal protein L18
VSYTSDIEYALKSCQSSLDYYNRSLRSSSSEVYTQKINKQIEEERTKINALEKMLPKKPIHEKNGAASVYSCPICRKKLSDRLTQKYCENCGQALDLHIPGN